MNLLVKVFAILCLISLLVSGCAALPAQVGEEKSTSEKVSVYKTILGKAFTDQSVVEFLAGQSCTSADQFLLCKTAGMALWMDSNQTVETVYLYLNNTDGFAPYQGELPFGLKFYDTMGAVEYKLGRQGVGDAGLPDTWATPDHTQIRAIYHEAGMTVIYNAPFPDEDATIHSILVSQ